MQPLTLEAILPKITQHEVSELNALVYVKDLSVEALMAIYDQKDASNIHIAAQLVHASIVKGAEDFSPLFPSLQAVLDLPHKLFTPLSKLAQESAGIDSESTQDVLNDTVDAMASDAGIAEQVKAELGNDETPTPDSE